MKIRYIWLLFGCLFGSCVLYHPTARVQKELDEVRTSLSQNHATAQRVFEECESYFNKLRNPAREEPYLTARKKLEAARSDLHSLDQVLREVSHAYTDFQDYSKGIDRIASNTPEWKKFKKTRATFKSSMKDLKPLFEQFTTSAEAYRNYMEGQVIPQVKRFPVSDYQKAYEQGRAGVSANQQQILIMVQHHRRILDGILMHVENKKRDPYPKLYAQLELMEKELKQISRVLQQLSPLLKEFNQKTRGYTEVWTSYPEWAAIDKMDKEIRSLFDEVKGVNARCKEFANQFSVIAAREKVGEVDAPSVLRDARKYMAEFNQKLTALQRDVKVVSNEELWQGLEEGEENMAYQEQIELLKGNTRELKKMEAEVIGHFDRLNEELEGKKKLWVGPGMAAWNAMDAFRARTDRVNAIGKQIAECSKKLQQLKP